jgi:hypothetical protein
MPEKTINIELTEEQALFVLKSLALGAEYFGSKSQWWVDRVAKEVGSKIEELGFTVFGWSERYKNYLANSRYDIKKVTISFYDKNPKVKPENHDG